MKKWLVFLLFAATYWAGQSQTLQFSKVLLVGTTPQTVPSGKVWKISGVAPSTLVYNANSLTPIEIVILINGASRVVGHTANYSTSYGVVSPSNVIDFSSFWLPDGTTLRTGANVGDISVIEFNIIP